MTQDLQFTLNVAATTANMLDGLEVSGNTARWDIMHSTIEQYSMGFIEFTLWLADKAYYSEKRLQERDPQDFPGVYDYEVSHSFGRWLYVELYERGLPTESDCHDKINELTEGFFTQGRLHDLA